MSRIDALPSDQRAVLVLVLQRGRSYDEIAQMLAIERGAVRRRALDALDTLAPEAAVEVTDRHLVGDYLLGQLPPRVASEVVQFIASSEGDARWAAAIAAQLASLGPLELPEVPEVPHDTGVSHVAAAAALTWGLAAQGISDPDAPEAVQTRQDAQSPNAPSAPLPAPDLAPWETAALAESGWQEPAQRGSGPPEDGHLPPAEPSLTPSSLTPSSIARPPGGSQAGEPRTRRLWPLVAAMTAVGVAVVVLVLALSGGKSSPAPVKTVAVTHLHHGTGSHIGTASTVATLPLSAPVAQSQATGVAQVVRKHGAVAIVIDAHGLPASGAHKAYAVWLSSGPGRSWLVGFVPSAVGHHGELRTEGLLPADAHLYHRLLLTLESDPTPTHPGTIVLLGSFRE